MRTVPTRHAVSTLDLQSDQIEIVSIGQIIVDHKAVAHGKSLIELDDIAAVWVLSPGEVTSSVVPWVRWLATAGVLVGTLSWWLALTEGLIASLGLLCYALYTLRRYPRRASVDQFALGVERKNGRTVLFKAADIGFLDEAAFALIYAVAYGGECGEKVVIDLDEMQVTFDYPMRQYTTIAAAPANQIYVDISV